MAPTPRQGDTHKSYIPVKHVLRYFGNKCLVDHTFLVNTRSRLHWLLQSSERIRVEKITPKDAHARNRILYIHGSAFVIGNSSMYRPLTYQLAKQCNSTVYVPEYSLAPESRYPKAIKEVTSVYEYILEHEEDCTPHDFAFVGDSAGGNLVAATMLKMILDFQRQRLPRCCVLLSPWLDLSATGVSHKERSERDPIIPVELVKPFGELYRPPDAPLSPEWKHSFLWSPVDAPKEMMEEFPSTLIHVGTEEVLLSDSTSFASKSPEKVQVKEWDGMWHVFQALAPFSSSFWLYMQPTQISDANESIREVSNFVRTCFEQQQPEKKSDCEV